MTHPRPAYALIALVVSTAVAAGCSDSKPDASSDRISSPESSSNVTPTPTNPGTAKSRTAPRTIRLSVHPQLAQVGRKPMPANQSLSSFDVKVLPVKQGGEVTLQAKTAGSWKKVAVGSQDRHGRVELNAPYARDGQIQTYRATVARRGAPALRSAPVRTDRFGEPDFNDDFDGRSLRSVWSHRLAGYTPASNRACSRPDPRAVRVAKGVVRLRVLADPDRNDRCATPDGKFRYRLNASISTARQASFTHGYFAARIKFQQLRGQHGAFWLQPQTREAMTGSPKLTGAEVDVIEWFGNDQPQGGLTSFVYDRTSAAGRKTGGFIRRPSRYGTDWSEKFHVFSVQWTPEEYVFRIDGRETLRTRRGVSGQPEYMILSLLSSDYELQYLEDEGRLPQTMTVDWVRHWSAP